MEKLVDYGLVFEKTPIGVSPKKNKSGTRYCMRDFYLNFYFQVLDGVKAQVLDNVKTNIFSNLLSSKTGFYLPGFSGLAFELLVESVIDCRASSSMNEPIFDKLGIHETDYRWEHYWEQGKTQIDLVVESSRDRESRILETKWIASKANTTRSYIEQLLRKEYSPPRGYRLSFYLILSKKPTKGLREAARKQEVQIIELGDLF